MTLNLQRMLSGGRTHVPCVSTSALSSSRPWASSSAGALRHSGTLQTFRDATVIRWLNPKEEYGWLTRRQLRQGLSAPHAQLSQGVLLAVISYVHPVFSICVETSIPEHTHTHTQAHTHAYLYICHTHIGTPKNAHTYMHTYTRTQHTYSQTRTHIPTKTDSHTHTQYTHKHTHTHK
jgi:hypothetical protein